MMDARSEGSSASHQLASLLYGLGKMRGNGHPIEIVEIDVSDENALTVARILAESLLPTRVYAHLLGERLMIVILPGVLAFVHRDDPQSATRAQRIGSLFDIPLAQMQFLEMFDVDHPDHGDTHEAI